MLQQNVLCGFVKSNCAFAVDQIDQATCVAWACDLPVLNRLPRWV
ncbi:hypothetical protein R2A130_2714 [Ahrensia sp. R2A130]|nr:hypothetical protein R2A130_2714 [Ahrensia sp. R2A130]